MPWGTGIPSDAAAFALPPRRLHHEDIHRQPRRLHAGPVGCNQPEELAVAHIKSRRTRHEQQDELNASVVNIDGNMTIVEVNADADFVLPNALGSPCAREQTKRPMGPPTRWSQRQTIPGYHARLVEPVRMRRPNQSTGTERRAGLLGSFPDEL
jgi:hypothetical protein